MCGLRTTRVHEPVPVGSLPEEDGENLEVRVARPVIGDQADWDSNFFPRLGLGPRSSPAAKSAVPPPVVCCVSLRGLSDDSGLSEECWSAEKPLPRPDWWSDADIAGFPAFRGLASATSLLDVRVVRHEPAQKQDVVIKSGHLYEEMGARDAKQHYLAVWFNMNDASLVFLAQGVDGPLLQRCLAGPFLQERLKLILVPVQVRLPMPAKGPRDAETIGSFFGSGSTGTAACRSRSGAQVTCVQIDLYSKWVMRVALQKVGLRVGNTIELVLVDWAEQAVLAGFRLIVTKTFAARVSS